MDYSPIKKLRVADGVNTHREINKIKQTQSELVICGLQKKYLRFKHI